MSAATQTPKLKPIPAGRPIDDMLDQFKKETDDLAFRCIENDPTKRGIFAGTLKDRAKFPHGINQGDSSLCGPASFMYCIVKRQPEEYVRYVLNLARIGEGHLGKMLVKPNNECTYQVKPKSEKGKWIDPVDWVALASLRDAYNDFVGMCTVKTPGGATLYGDMAKWFTRTGWYSNVTDGRVSDTGKNSYGASFSPSKLDNLLEIVPGNSDTCLMVDADILKGRVPASPVMNHWIVLHGAIMIDGVSSPQDVRNKVKDIENKKISFRFWSWGWDLNDPPKTTLTATVRDFLSCYYGYVSADPF